MMTLTGRGRVKRDPHSRGGARLGVMECREEARDRQEEENGVGDLGFVGVFGEKGEG